MLRRSPLRRRTDPKRRARADARRLEALAERFEAADEAHPGIRTDWEREFLESVPARLRDHGRAFAREELADPADADAPLSLRQRRKARELGRLLRDRLKDAAPADPPIAVAGDDPDDPRRS